MAYDYVPITVGNTAKFLQVAFGTGCSVQSGSQPAETVILDAMPATPEGNEVLERNCINSGETEAVYVNEPPVNNGGGGGGNNPLPTDGTAWTQGNPNDKDDKGVSVTFSPPVILIDSI